MDRSQGRFATALAMVLIGSCSAANSDEQFKRVFGSRSTPRTVQTGRLARYKIQLRVESGESLSIRESNNQVLTCVDGNLVSGAPVLEEGRFYVYGAVDLARELGYHVITCVVRVKSGPLSGALVWIVPPETAFGGSIGDPYQACYPLPENLSLKAGALEFEVVAFTVQ